MALLFKEFRQIFPLLREQFLDYLAFFFIERGLQELAQVLDVQFGYLAWTCEPGIISHDLSLRERDYRILDRFLASASIKPEFDCDQTLVRHLAYIDIAEYC
ncbi:hypothetical protein [Bradyrhizobium sp. dw_78]|uniref:hypothetical protein n=1 Tax=Bradyrhizobium sp. dw_78 TaxID=2719793 RepID=UPI001BD3021F|nr:hypothetical protein [Bradyrhizobium sp. dw_78]